MSCAVRNLAVFGVVLWTDVQPLTMCSTELSAGARAAMFLFHQLACPGLILIVYYQLSSWLKERNKIVERLDALAERRLVRSKQLTLSLVPDFASESLNKVPPIFWHRVPALNYTDCTLIQMDIVGFSGIVSRLNVLELVDVLNSLFSAIDFAAKCIGKVWKVETIGDCYIGVIGGPQPCEDHADRAILLAASIRDIVDVFSRAMTFPLTVRIGLHSGNVQAAVMGRLLPRYLVFGRDMEVVNHLETVATEQSVRVSSSTVALSKWEWVYATHGDVTHMANQEPVTSNLLTLTSEENKEVLSYNRKLYPFLSEFHRELAVSLGVISRTRGAWKRPRASLGSVRAGIGASRATSDGIADEFCGEDLYSAQQSPDLGGVDQPSGDSNSSASSCGRGGSRRNSAGTHSDLECGSVVNGQLAFGTRTTDQDYPLGTRAFERGGTLQPTRAEAAKAKAIESADRKVKMSAPTGHGASYNASTHESTTNSGSASSSSAGIVDKTTKSVASKVLWWTKSVQWKAPDDLVHGAGSLGGSDPWGDGSTKDGSNGGVGSSTHPSSDASSTEREKSPRTWRDNWLLARTTNSGRFRVPHDNLSATETTSQEGGGSFNSRTNSVNSRNDMSAGAMSDTTDGYLRRFDESERGLAVGTDVQIPLVRWTQILYLVSAAGAALISGGIQIYHVYYLPRFAADAAGVRDYVRAVMRAAAAHGEPMALPQSMESGEVLSPGVEEFQESRYWSSCCQADAHLGLAVASGHAFLKVSSGRWRRGHGLVR